MPSSWVREQRAWAWWSTGTELLAQAASTTVDHLWVAGPSWRRRMDLHPYAYRRITGQELSAATDRLIGARPGYRRAVASVRSLERDAVGGAVELDLSHSGGDRAVEVTARGVFDSVGVGASPGGFAATAYLDFHGLHVECPTDTFDPGAASLMDLRTDQAAGAAFVNVLPTTARTALVERTVFAFSDTYDRDAESARHEAHVHDYLHRHLSASDYRVTGREVGTIPLRRGPVSRPTGPVIPIGARAGTVKASTGYGFARIQRHSAAIASHLVRDRSPAHAAPARRWSRAMDEVLLRIIREEPVAGVEVFAVLLMRNPASRIFAFLDEDASLLSQFRLGRTLPLAPFTRAFARMMTGRRAVTSVRGGES